MNIFHALILGLVQGLTEFLPVSSSAHLILVERFFNWQLDNSLSFAVFLNTATLFSVIYCFWGDIRRIFIDFTTEGFSSRSNTMLFALAIGTVPAALFGFFYSDTIESSFWNLTSVAWALVIGSLIMLLADSVGAYKKNNDDAGITGVKGLVIGLFQALALFPGMSRSGSSISGGLLMRLSREEAIKFSFLLYIPVSLGAAFKSYLDLDSGTAFSTFASLPYIIGFFAALISGAWAIRFMVRYLTKNSFTPFVIYRLALAVIIFLFLI